MQPLYRLRPFWFQFDSLPVPSLLADEQEEDHCETAC